MTSSPVQEPRVPARVPAGVPGVPARTAEQDQFAASLHDLLGPGAPDVARRWAAGDHSPGLALWRELAGLGVTGLAVPLRWGGLGASPMDVVVACEELGHHALPGPAAESLAAVPVLLAALGDDTLCERWLPGLASGEVIATLALPPRVPYAVDADVCGLMLLAGADAVYEGTPGRRHRSVDGGRWLFELGPGRELVRVSSAVVRARSRALQTGTLATAAQLLGAGEALLEQTVRHARQRVQFGRPVGAFQAVQHRLADVAIGLEFARPLLYAAAIGLGAADPAAARDVSAAKVACADAAHRAARAALQVHGAIGYTQELDLGLWLAKVRALLPAWGTQAEHRALVLEALTAGEESAWS
jgi:alkylation response protein AidB-like acyl-CoA dehydrogenase